MIKINAHYDNVNGKPSSIEKDNNGETIIRIRIAEEYDEENKVKGWQCYEVRVSGEATKVKAKKAIIRSVMDESREFDLINSYNKHQLGIDVNEEAVTKYKAWLQFTHDLDADLDFFDSNSVIPNE